MRWWLAVFASVFCTVHGQQIDEELRRNVEEIYGNPNSTRNGEFLPGFEEVTRPTGGSLGAIERCGEGSDQGVHICVSYYMCDGKTKTVVQTGVTDGFGIIDIRFGENSCTHPLEVCCKLPEGGLDPNLPQPGDPPTPPTSSPPTTPPPFTPIVPPVTTAPAQSFCGIRHPSGIDFQITGQRDNEAEYGEFPWMVAVLNKNGNPSLGPNKLICGGSLLTPNVVLTGAHCVFKARTEDLSIRAGEWDTQTARERLPYQERNVVNIVARSDFNSGNLFNDVALLVLDRPIVRADNVGTVCLPTQGQRVVSRECFVSGWGKDTFGKQGEFQAILKKIQLPTVDRQRCQNALKNTRLGQGFSLHSSFMCAGGEQGKDACTGDGGSPLVCPDPLNPTRYVQVGIVAWGIGCGTQNVPGVYADVARFRSWIDEQMERLNFDTAPYNL
ncbi:unnamed protein product [Phaedon cochleariae]|uniref:Phenoloxidase-activating factor 2 n=1 Tax=Phaedon cochleariae TaxID=80249 RepID=A0A9P0DXL0_PHACE|nr:unnamed protein product [Phaedon cochleariae]